MNSIVPSLELCKELATYVKLDTCFVWVESDSFDPTLCLRASLPPIENKYIPAPLASELGETLPEYAGEWFLEMYKDSSHIDEKEWFLIRYVDDDLIMVGFADKSESDARCKMLIYLYANKLMKSEEASEN